jgi:putative tricarboxylic transport membrane protein
MKNDRSKYRLLAGLFLRFVICSLMLIVAVDDGKAANPADSYPSRQIEVVVHTGPGSSSDTFGRMLTESVQREKAFSQPMAVVNKTGGSGAVQLAYVFERKANPHVVLIASSVFVTTPLVEKLPYNYKSFTPIANVCVDGSLLVVRSDSPYKTIDDLIADAKKRPKELIQGGSSLAGFESMMGRAVQKAMGVQWNFIPLASGPETIVSLLGGHVNFIFASPADIRDHVRAGKMRPLLAGAPKRYTEFNSVPTMEEKGMGKAMASYRGVVGPPDMPEYAVKKLEAAFKKAAESAPFKKFLDDTVMQPLWLGPAEYAKLLEDESARVKGWLTEMDLLKK